MKSGINVSNTAITYQKLDIVLAQAQSSVALAYHMHKVNINLMLAGGLSSTQTQNEC